MGHRRSKKPVLPVTLPSLPPFEEYTELLREVWDTHWLTNQGPLADRLEAGLRRYLPSPHVDAVTNGTLALQLSYRAVFPRKGVVITTPFTFAATTTSLVWEGYTPRFVDIDPVTFNLDPALVDAALRDDVVGIVAVHVFGNPAGGPALSRLAASRNVKLVFDAAHAFGVRTRPVPLWSLGNASTLSFHATKSFHSFEGGAVVTSEANVSRRVRRLRNFGLRGPEEVVEAGINAKLNEAQAAMGLLNLRYIDGWIRLRKERYDRYRSELEGTGGVQFQELAKCRYNYTYMPILLPTKRLRDRVARDLERSGVRPRKYFFPPTHVAPYLRGSRRASCPVAESVSSRVLCLPLHPALGVSDVRRISAIVRTVVQGR
jgi:dTDP-4-amino-4,6-dideoxygalactose transaminase